jgi:aminopeptidase N
VSGVLDQVTDHLAFVDEYLTSADARPRFESFVRGLLRPAFDEVGFATVPSEPDDRRALRAVVVDALGTVANDADVAAKARTALDRSLAGAEPLDATLAAAVVQTAAVHGDAKLFDSLVAAAERATSPENHYRYLNALASFGEPALIDRALQQTLSSSMRNQDAGLYLARFFGNPAARSRAWDFLTHNWSALEPKMNIVGSDARIVAAAGQFCDAKSRDAIAAFFAAHPLPGAIRTLQQTIERIDNCIALREAQTPAVTAWLNAR